jgi:hypothetical protein
VRAKIVKIVGWTLGTMVGVVLILDGKIASPHEWQHALIGAAIGLVLGIIFARNLGRKATNR